MFPTSPKYPRLEQMKRSIAVGGSAFAFAVSVAVGVAACGGVTSGSGAPGTGSVTGTVGGISLNVADTVVIAESGTLGVDARTLLVYLFDIPNVCAVAHSLPANADKGNYTALQLQVSSYNSGSSMAGPVVAGTYAIGGQTATDGGTGARASARLQKNDAQCKSLVPSADHAASGGTITITAISATAVSGSYSVTFADGTMSGAFDAAFCAMPDRTQQPPPDGGSPCVP